MDATSAHWIFQVVSRRYERGSIVLTSNRGFGDWGQVFADQVVASAILDCLLRHATLVTIKGQSYRMRAHAPSAKEGAVMLSKLRSPPHLSWRSLCTFGALSHKGDQHELSKWWRRHNRRDRHRSHHLVPGRRHQDLSVQIHRGPISERPAR